jgi:PAS domain S-box-containing protein
MPPRYSLTCFIADRRGGNDPRTTAASGRARSPGTREDRPGRFREWSARIRVRAVDPRRYRLKSPKTILWIVLRYLWYRDRRVHSPSFPLQTESPLDMHAEPQSPPASLSEQELRGIVDAIPHVIVVLGPDGAPIYANKWMLDFMGLTDAEVRQPGVRARVFHPDDLVGLETQRREAMSHGLPFETEQRARRHDGQYRWFLYRYYPVRDEQGRILRWYVPITDRVTVPDPARPGSCGGLPRSTRPVGDSEDQRLQRGSARTVRGNVLGDPPWSQAKGRVPTLECSAGRSLRDDPR